MSKNNIRLIIFFAAFTIIGIIGLQLFWSQENYAIKEKQFNQQVLNALKNVVKTIERESIDTSKVQKSIRQSSSNSFLVSSLGSYTPEQLNGLLIKNFNKSGIHSDFEYVVYDCSTDSIVLVKQVKFKEKVKKSGIKKSDQKRWRGKCYYFRVHFPSKHVYLLSGMRLWVVSGLFLLLVILFFSYNIWFMIKQKKLSEIRTDFINNMSHELKNPISTISLSAEVLKNPNFINDPEKLTNYANTIQEEAERLKSQLEKVLQIATIDKKKVLLEKKKVNLHQIIKNTVKGFRIILDSKEAEIECELKASHSTIMGDETHLTNILFNLIDNSIKYCERQAKIKISTENHKSGIYLRVVDNGIGMSRQDQKHVFEKFYRISAGEQEDVKGYGIGLNYVLRMVKQHRGKIQLKSQLKSGSTFRIYFPLAKNGQ